MSKKNDDFMSAIKSGHSGSIAGNPAHADMNIEAPYTKSNRGKLLDSIIKNCTTTIKLNHKDGAK